MKSSDVPTFITSETTAKLRERLPRQHETLHDFACALTDRLAQSPLEELFFASFILQADFLLADIARGADVPASLAGLPGEVLINLRASIPVLARRCLPPDAAEAAVHHLLKRAR